MEITSKVRKIFNNPKNHVVVLEDDFKVSSFGKCPEEIKEGETYTFKYGQKGEWNNYFHYVKVGEEPLKVSYEDVFPVVEKKDDNKNTKIEVFEMDSFEGMRDAVNIFNSKVNGFATQTHIVSVNGNGMTRLRYCAVVFYK